MEEVIGKLRVLFGKALQGTLELEELYAEWPEETRYPGILEQLYEDILDAVEHFPGESHLADWRGSWEYTILYVDSRILNKVNDLSLVQECRELALREWKSPGRIDTVIDRCLETKGNSGDSTSHKAGFRQK